MCAAGRYGVLTGGRHLAVRPINLDTPTHAQGDTEPLQFAVRICGACGVVGLVSTSPSLEEASRHCQVLLRPCGGCREAVYCSKNCQKSDWNRHRPCCLIVKDARDLIRAYAEDPALNAMLCERADEEVEDMPRRRLIHFQCPNPQTLQDLRDKSKLMAPGGVDVDVQYAPAVDDDGADEVTGEAAAWEAAMEQTREYDADREISFVVSTPTLDGTCVVMPALVPRLF